MKLTLIALILTLSLCFSAYMLNRNPEIEDLIERIEHVEAEVRALRVEMIGYKAVIWERTAPFTHVIPVSGGFLGITE